MNRSLFFSALTALTIAGIFGLSIHNSIHASTAANIICSGKNACVNSPSQHRKLAFPSSTQAQATPASDVPIGIGKWHLVRTLGPEHVGEIVSIMHTADALRSDPDFAGLMIRCSKKSILQIGLVTIRPFPPRSRPRVTISAGSSRLQLQASVIPPGSILALPDEAQVFARGPWQSASELSVGINDGSTTISGIVPLDDLGKALASLEAGCAEQ